MSQTARGSVPFAKQYRNAEASCMCFCNCEVAGGFGGVRVLDLGLWDEGLGLGIDV